MPENRISSIERYYTFVTKLVLAWFIILPLFSLLRLAAPGLGLDLHFIASFANIIIFGIFIIASCVVFLDFIFLKKVDLTHILAFFFLFYGVFVGLLHNGFTSEFFKHFYLVIFSVIFFTIGLKSFSFWSLEKLRSFTTVSFGSNVLSVVLFAILSTVIFIYPGYGTQGAAYVLMYYLATGQRLMSFLCVVVIVSQGKRSILFSALLCMVFFWVSQKIRSRIALPLSIFASAFFVSIFLYFIEAFNLYTLSGMSRIRYINPFSASFDVYMGSSGRVDEILSLFNSFKDNAVKYVTGLGVGFSYEWTLSYNEEHTEAKSYLHSTPIMAFILFGPLITTVIYAYFLSVIGGILSKSYKPGIAQEEYWNFLALSSLFFLISGFFSLNALSDPLGWILLGLSCALYKRFKIGKSD
ncbi:hypothetical protein [Pseudoalteromonas sp. DY56-GL79]|uniref:hypothetical protein n=1 Tax=Pseudoalteromonas sp. DY56-GL79 TaxID=2967131 RepID=UPI00352B88BB